MQRLVQRCRVAVASPAIAMSHWRSFTTAMAAPRCMRTAAVSLRCVLPLRRSVHSATSNYGLVNAAPATPQTPSATRAPSSIPAPATGAKSKGRSTNSGSGSSAVGNTRNSDAVGTSSEIAVPIIDLSGYFSGSAATKLKVANQIGEACERIGFMTIINHGLSKELVDRTWSETRNYFDLAESEKNLVPMTADYPYGYIGFANENLSRGYDGKRSAPDLKECFCIGPYNIQSGMPAIRWPSNQPAICNAWLDYYKAMEDLSRSLLRCFALALKLPTENWFDDKITRHRSAFRMLNYPPQSNTPLPGQIRAGEHTDYGTLTILKSDENVSGLQVLARNGKWYDVAPVKDSFVVNIGDLMQRWTNDRWVSTLHRVVNPSGQTVTNTRRQSMAFFHNLNGDAVVSAIPTCVDAKNPAKYPPIEAWKHLIEKHEASTKGVKPK